MMMAVVLVVVARPENATHHDLRDKGPQQAEDERFKPQICMMPLFRCNC